MVNNCSLTEKGVDAKQKYITIALTYTHSHEIEGMAGGGRGGWIKGGREIGDKWRREEGRGRDRDRKNDR